MTEIITHIDLCMPHCLSYATPFEAKAPTDLLKQYVSVNDSLYLQFSFHWWTLCVYMMMAPAITSRRMTMRKTALSGKEQPQPVLLTVIKLLLVMIYSPLYTC